MIDTDWEHAARERGMRTCCGTVCSACCAYPDCDCHGSTGGCRGRRFRTFADDLAAPPASLRAALVAFACLWWPGAFESDSLLAASDAFRMFAERGTPVDPAPEWDW